MDNQPKNPVAVFIGVGGSAAPPDISGKATVYVLERTGYVKVRAGTNGFIVLRTCFTRQTQCLPKTSSRRTRVGRMVTKPPMDLSKLDRLGAKKGGYRTQADLASKARYCAAPTTRRDAHSKPCSNSANTEPSTADD